MFGLAVKVVLNYLIIQLSIILFMAPFYLWYQHTHTQEEESKISLNRRIELFFLSKQANWLVFFWALGEALVWFVIPEFLLLLVVFMRIRRKRELLVYDIAGTLIGTMVAFLTHFSNQTISSLPYIQSKMVYKTSVWYSQKGIFGLLYQPFSGVPYKVFTLMANQFHFFIIGFLIFALIVRMSRYVIFFGLFTSMYPGLHKYVYRNYFRLFLIATFIFSALLLKVYLNYS